MDLFKRTNVGFATKLDVNCKCFYSRGRSNDKRMINRYARRKLRVEVSKWQ